MEPEVGKVCAMTVAKREKMRKPMDRMLSAVQAAEKCQDIGQRCSNRYQRVEKNWVKH
jgi:hypothetical protein